MSRAEEGARGLTLRFPVFMSDALPELSQLADLHVRLPRLEIAALERIALRERRSLDAVLARELRDLVSPESAWLSAEIPGFAHALHWP